MSAKRTDKVEFYRGRPGAGGWRWRYRTGNGRILADSGEGYIRLGDAVKGAARVIDPAIANVQYDPRTGVFYGSFERVGRYVEVVRRPS